MICMRKIDEQILKYLTPCEINHVLWYGNDTYYCGGSKHLSKRILDSRIEKTSHWVKANGGRFEIETDWIRHNDDYVRIVQVIFPSYGKRNMKEIMSTLFIINENTI